LITFVDNHLITAGELIRRLAARAQRIDIGMAFLTLGGWRLVRDALTDFCRRGGQLRVVLRPQARNLSVTALAELRQLPRTEVRFHVDAQFHPKRWNFHCGGTLFVLSGSANLTKGGLESNPEDGALLALPADSLEARQATAIFEDWWRHARPVTDADVTALKAQRAVPGAEKPAKPPPTSRARGLPSPRRTTVRRSRGGVGACPERSRRGEVSRREAQALTAEADGLQAERAGDAPAARQCYLRAAEAWFQLARETGGPEQAERVARARELLARAERLKGQLNE